MNVFDLSFACVPSTWIPRLVDFVFSSFALAPPSKRVPFPILGPDLAAFELSSILGPEGDLDCPGKAH